MSNIFMYHSIVLPHVLLRIHLIYYIVEAHT